MEPYGFGSFVPKGGPERDYSDSPLNQQTTEVAEEPLPLDELAAEAQDSLETLRAVISELRATTERHNAALFLDTASLWLERAFEANT